MREPPHTSAATPPVRYRVGHRGLDLLNSYLMPLGVTARQASFDRNSLLIYGDDSLYSASHELLPSRTGGQHGTPVSVISVLVPCTGLEPGKPRPETPLPVAFADLIKSLFQDALLQPQDPTSQHGTRLDRFFRNPFHASDWWKFHYPRSRLHGVESNLGDRYAFVHHSTLECYRAYFRFLPSLDPFNDEPFRPPAPANNFATLITYRDVVAGQTQARLEAVVNQAAQGDFDGILVRTTCVPDMVGDSPVRLLRGIASTHGKETHWVAKTHATPDTMALILEQRLATLRKRPPATEGWPVILAGVESQPLADELALLLKPLGIQVTQALLPNLTLSGSASDPAPRACIWVNSFGWNELLSDQLLPTMPVVRTFPPCGLEATRQWLLRIAQVLQIPDAESKIRPNVESCRAELKRFEAQAQQLPVALVGDASDLSILSARSPFSGFSLLAILKELGFPVTCLRYTREGTNRPPSAPPGSPVHDFSTPAQLQSALKEFALAYTDFNVDRRLLASGVAGFGSSLIEPGFQGLIRTGRLLLYKAEHRPFQRFGQHLSAVWRPTP